MLDLLHNKNWVEEKNLKFKVHLHNIKLCERHYILMCFKGINGCVSTENPALWEFEAKGERTRRIMKNTLE